MADWVPVEVELWVEVLVELVVPELVEEDFVSEELSETRSYSIAL